VNVPSNVSQIDMVKPEALWQRVVEAMRRAIVVGELHPGVHLKELALAERFGVSRLPIREAIAQLEREGLVRIEPRRGAYVVGLTTQDIHDIYECRVLLESCALRRAATRVTEQDIARLKTFIAQMEAGVAAGQVQLVAAMDMNFHRLLITLSGNRALANAWEPVAPLIEAALGIADANVPDLPGAVHGHYSIAQALEQHDADAAITALAAHLPGGERLVHEAIKRVREGRGSVRLV